jgi:GNAT superfamily N-acetyltransferase
MEEIRVREFTEGDIDHATEIMHASMLTVAEDVGGFKREHLETRTIDITRSRVGPAFTDGGNGLVAEVTELTRPAGFALWKMEGAEAELKLLYVDPTAQCKGVGQRLLEEVLNRVASEDAESLTLWTMSWNTQSQGFYEKRGFVLTNNSEPTVFLGTCNEDGNEIPYEVVEYKKSLRNA